MEKGKLVFNCAAESEIYPLRTSILGAYVHCNSSMHGEMVIINNSRL